MLVFVSSYAARERQLINLSRTLPELPGRGVSLKLKLSPTSQRRSRISRPAAIASTASTVLTVVETRTFSNGKSPVRINQTASKIIPKFLPARVLVRANLPSSSLISGVRSPQKAKGEIVR